ncbi:YvcK family protein, partial [Rhizobium leguminosarum]
SANLGFDDARKEFLFYAEGRHPLLERMEPGLRGAILNYLNTFATSVVRDFDFRHGSVGNFILTGACVAHKGDVNTKIAVLT